MLDLDVSPAILYRLDRLDRLKDEVRLQAGVPYAPHYGAKEDGLEVATVIGEMAMWLSEGGDDLRHFKAEHTIRVRKCGPVAVRVPLVSFCGVRPDLNALTRKRGAVTCAPYGARHPEAPTANPVHEQRTRAVVVGSVSHRACRCDARRTSSLS